MGLGPPKGGSGRCKKVPLGPVAEVWKVPRVLVWCEPHSPTTRDLSVALLLGQITSLRRLLALISLALHDAC